MEFGRVAQHQVEKINFRLPPEPAINASILQGFADPAPQIHPGCPSWSRPEWVGKLYPKGTKPDQFLLQYLQHFSGIELNTTYYKIYTPTAVKKWVAQSVGTNFKFCPKLFQGITHEGNLLNKYDLVNAVLPGLEAFGAQLGPIFIQLHDSFSPNRKDELIAFLGALPNHLQFFLELRHPGWFGKPAEREQLFGVLQQLQVGAIITDTPGRRDCAHMQLTVPKAFIRFVANGLHATDYSRIDEWVKRIHIWLQQGLRELYFFIHMQNELHSPHLVLYLVNQLNAVTGMSLLKPVFLPEQKSLFD